MKNVKLFIWDFDGTLMDTYPFTTSCLKKALADFGHEVDQVEILEKMMVTIGHAVRFYSEAFDLPGLKDRYTHYHSSEAREKTAIFPHVDDALRAVRARGGINAVFTNRGDSTYAMLDKGGIRELFDCIVTADSPHFKVKPAPDTILWLMHHYGVTPEQTVMIGDRRLDLESAYAAGCKTCHLVTPAVVQEPECDWRIWGFEEMTEMLSGRTNREDAQ